ncbi:Dyp-type peroxidase [Corynebacterium camporealensis]|uniref:Dyp-type peroxidase n=1 Tax=Corynebacterium camporealensis TaxID=161896 RepID=UPI0034CEBD06
MTGVSRRGFLGGATIAAGAAAVAGCSNAEEDAPAVSAAGTDNPVLKDAIVPFDGEHQAGISTPVQANLQLVGFDLQEGVDKQGLANLLRLWTADARNLCTGETPLGSLEPEMVQAPSNLTITCGLGEPVFELLDVDKPEWLGDVREFERDELDPQWGQTDLVLQICCDDPVMGSHALRHMVRAGSSYADVVWLQSGFSDAFGAREKSETPRNLFGQIDGTVNPREPQEFADQVWIDEGPEWAQGGSAMVVRRIRMNLDTWEELDRPSREDSVGRKLSDGAPLTGNDEHDEPDLEATDKYGLPVINPNSHMALSRPPADKPNQKLLRRPYNYDLPPDPQTPDQLSNAGLIFICYQKDPTEQFEPIQARLDESDILNTWVSHIGSAMYFCPPGTEGESWWAESLVDSAKL